MDIYVYTDESGVFDVIHNDYYVFGGLVFMDSEKRDLADRLYSAAENVIRTNGKYSRNFELKACRISNSEKGSLFRATNKFFRYVVVIDQNQINKAIFKTKKSKRRYLDYAYKIGLKRALEHLISINIIDPHSVENVYVYQDEHTTATDGLYLLQKGLETEFKNGTKNFTWTKFFPPIFPNLLCLNLEFKNSAKTTLIRAADIVCNRAYYCVTHNNVPDLCSKIFVSFLP